MANPLTLVMPINEGVTLQQLAELLGGGSQKQIDAALEQVGTVHYARFVIFDRSSPNLQPSAGSTGPFGLGVITEFDGSFDDYIQDFVNILGPIFDALLAFTNGAYLIPVSQNLDAFTKYVSDNNLSTTQSGLYQAYTATVQTVLAYVPAGSGAPESTGPTSAAPAAGDS